MKYARHWIMLFGFLLLPGSAWAGPTVQADMTITGHIEIAADGSVTGYQLDRASRIPPAAKALVAKAAHTWRFEPVRVNGKAVPAKSNMSVHLVARQTDKGDYSIHVDGAWFKNKHAVNKSSTLLRTSTKPPRYPMQALRGGAQGTVYTVVRINRQGKVDKVATRQVNLVVRGSPGQMRAWRKALAKACRNAVSHWTFAPPTTGPHADQSHWVAVVPIHFRISSGNGPTRAKDRARRNYGKWQAFLPGPKHEIPWLKSAQKRLVANAGALPDHGVFTVGQTLHLLTSLSGGS